ncbi:MAG: hypothetical protein QOK07_2903, partial [Gemmatimonadaceae bacterium]|nr:hypothetical protein [Gemmatimonadaceae bacterium]
GSPARAWTRSVAGWVPHVLLPTADFPSGYAEPTDINEGGIIVGFATDASGSSRAVKWIPNSTGWDAAVPLDNIAASNYGGANAILGDDIVGNILICFTCRPLRVPYHWSLTAGQGIGSLGTADAWAEGLNKERSIVGSFSYGGIHAFVRTLANPTIRDLGAPNGYGSASAYDINSPTSTRPSSQAVGQATSRRGNTTAVLWTLQ